MPAYLGFSRCNVPAVESVNGSYPRFFYGDVSPGDNGFWLIPDAQYIGTNKNLPVYYLEAPAKINLMGNAYFYLELDGMNVIDETLPYALNNFTAHTNESASVVKSAFAKIAITTTPIAQWFDNNSAPLKIYNPPAERIKKIRLRLRYHNGSLVDFGKFNYSIMLEFVVFRPQSAKNYKMFVPEAIGNS